MKPATRRKMAGALAALSIGATHLHAQNADGLNNDRVTAGSDYGDPNDPSTFMFRPYTAEETKEMLALTAEEKKLYKAFQNNMHVFRTIQNSSKEMKDYYYSSGLKNLSATLLAVSTVEELNDVLDKINKLKDSVSDTETKKFIQALADTAVPIIEHTKCIKRMQAIDQKVADDSRILRSKNKK